MDKKLQQVGRLALRQEGGGWNAYYAMPDTMKGAVLIGSVRMGAMMGRPERKKQFMTLMRDIVADIIEENHGTRPVFPDEPVTAPAHERAGNG